MSLKTKSRASPEDQKLFLQVRNHILAHSPDYRIAGAFLDAYWSFDAFQERKRADLHRSFGVAPEDPLPEWYLKHQHESRVRILRQVEGIPDDEPFEPVIEVFQTPPENRETVRLMECINSYHRRLDSRSDALDLSLLPDDERVHEARLILLLTWLATDHDAGSRGLTLTTLENVPYHQQNALGRRWSRVNALEISASHWDDWMDLVRSALLCVSLDEAPKKASSRASALPARAQRAYGQYKRAAQAGCATDREAYSWIRENEDPDGLPSLETWTKYVREARRVLGASKYRKGGASKSRSVIEIDERDDVDRN